MSRLPHLAALLIALLAVFVAAHFARLGVASGFVDMGHDGYQLREVLDLMSGAHVFRDTFDQYGPLGAQLNLVGFLTLGRSLLAIKYFIAVCYGLTALAQYFVARHFLGAGLSLFSVVVWLALGPFYQQGVMISPHAYASFVQAAALLLMLRFVERPRVTHLLATGALCGLTCLLKQSIGVLLLGGFVLFITVNAIREEPSPGRAVVRRLLFLLSGFAIVVLVAGAVLVVRGAARDWYLQTIIFPSMFYAPGAASFVALQVTAEPIWMAIRLVVIGGALVAMRGRGKHERELVLTACVTLTLWLGAFPSANFMHQWWTASLAIPAAVYVVRAAAVGVAHRIGWTTSAGSAFAAAAIVIAIAPSVQARADSAKERSEELSSTIALPPLLAGIRTDP
jgi:Dolichyl-phosphate-mannose-protein mannosyltransferase